MPLRRGWPALLLGLAGCARIVGLDELREERGLQGVGGQGAPDAAVAAVDPLDLGQRGAPPQPELDAGAPATGGPGQEVMPRVVFDGAPVRVTVVKSGTGTVVSVPAGITCGAACSAEFPAGTDVTLEALTENGDGSIFSVWGPETGCSTQRRCELPTLTRNLDVSASFRAPFNPIFASSVPVSPTLGGVEEYDRVCNELTLRAGFNTSVTGSYYLAVMSDSLNSFRDRLGSFASNWELVDGSTFATTAFELFERDAALRAIDLDENGTLVSDRRQRRYLTGTLADGSPSPNNCNDWTDPSFTATAGVAAAGPGSWLMGDTVSCAEPQYLLCISAYSMVQILLPEPLGRPRIWLSRTRFVPGTITPDEHCRLNLPPGVLDASALISHMDRPARAALSLGLDAEYTRPDGVIVGTAEEIATFRTRAGIWQGDDLTYVSPYRTGTSADVWTGQTDLDRVGSAESTCNDWTQPSGVGVTGRYDVHRRAFWGEPDPATGGATRGVSCADPAGAHLYCVGTP